MSNIEPTEITRTMRCPRCQRTDTHTIDRSIAGEPVACWPCSGEGHRVACVVVEAPIEPTEEQMQANAPVTEELLAREAERIPVVGTLRVRLTEWRGLVEMHKNDADTLRARVAELEAEASNLRARVALVCIERDNLEESEAQHLADIKALRTALASVCIDILTSPAVTDTMWSHRSGLSTTNDYIASVLGIDTVDAYGKPTAELVRLAHYDDAKATEGGEG